MKGELKKKLFFISTVILRSSSDLIPTSDLKAGNSESSVFSSESQKKIFAEKGRS